MIETLNGIRETINFRKYAHIKLYINNWAEHYPPHWHREIEILMPIEGHYSAIISNHVYDLGPGDLLLIPSGVVHNLPLQPTGVRFIFQFDPECIELISGIATVLSLMNPACLIRVQDAPAASERCQALMMEIRDLYRSTSAMAEAGIYAKIIEMITVISDNLREQHLPKSAPTARAVHEEQLMQVCHYIAAHSNESMSLEKAAAGSGFSKYYFERLFRNYTGMSFYQYLTFMRVSHAELLLQNQNVTISQIAEQSGFSNGAVFSKVFRKVTGFTPSAYREKYRDETQGLH